MAKESALKADGALIVGVVVIYLGNYLSVQLWNYPFIYCLGEVPARHLYLSFAPIVLYILFGFMIWKALRMQIGLTVLAVILIVGLLELPLLSDSMFRLGGSCGS